MELLVHCIIDRPPILLFIRADFADNEQIEELLAWTHPHLGSSSAAPSPNAVIFTEAENLAMLRLPRKECKNASTISFSMR
jgi:hypothetical protein